MKKLTYISLFFISFVLLTSCHKDAILDKVPSNIISDANVWSSQNLIDAFLTEQYNLSVVVENECQSFIASWSEGSPVDGSWNIYTADQGAGPFVVNEVSDECQPGWNISYWPPFYKAGGLTVSGGLLEWWEYPYYIIRNLNEFIAKVPSSPVDTSWAHERIAEARFMRALHYFELVKRYGGVPLITKVQQLNDPKNELFPKRSSEQQIYDFVLSELDTVAAVLGTSPTYGRPCKWTALALQSRVALYAGSISQFGTVQLNGVLGIPSSLSSAYYQKAYNTAQAVINSGVYQLYNGNPNKVVNFKSLWLIKQNCEVIYAKQHNYIDALGGGGNSWGYDFCQRPKPHAWNLGMENCAYLELAQEFENTDGTSGQLDLNAIQQGLWSINDLFGKKDPRFWATLYTQETPWLGGQVDFHNGLIDPNGNLLTNSQAYNGIAAQGNQNIFGNFHTGFGCMKYLDSTIGIGSTWGGSGTDYIILRYGEVLLNFAEAAFELGKTNDALTAVNQIRNRAGIKLLTTIDRDHIRHERKVELAFEGHRYWDLRRWRTATSALSRNFSGLQYILDYNTRKYKIVVLNNIDGNLVPSFSSANYYLPITLSRTQINPNLVENPGY